MSNAAPKAHTPGKWAVDEDGADNNWQVVIWDGEVGRCPYTEIATGCSEADARLIAAAPDLLDALAKAEAALVACRASYRECVRALNEHGHAAPAARGYEEAGHAEIIARAALARATVSA